MKPYRHEHERSAGPYEADDPSGHCVVCGEPWRPEMSPEWQAGYAAGVAAEREACAEEAKLVLAQLQCSPVIATPLGDEVAAAIRSRKP